MISGLHSHCSVGVDLWAFCAVKQKRPLWAESQQEGVICDSNRSTKRVWKKERNWQVCLRPYSPLTVSGFQREAAGRLFCVQAHWGRGQGATSRASGARVMVMLGTESAPSSCKSIRSSVLGFWGHLYGISWWRFADWCSSLLSKE